MSQNKKEKKNGKWLILQEITTISYYDLEGSVQNAVAHLQGIKMPNGFERIELRTKPRDYEEGYELVAIAIRSANEEEMKTLEQEETAKLDENKAWRRKQYEQLKKEFD
jgi:hypothetical protein